MIALKIEQFTKSLFFFHFLFHFSFRKHCDLWKITIFLSTDRIFQIWKTVSTHIKFWCLMGKGRGLGSRAFWQGCMIRVPLQMLYHPYQQQLAQIDTLTPSCQTSNFVVFLFSRCGEYLRACKNMKIILQWLRFIKKNGFKWVDE